MIESFLTGVVVTVPFLMFLRVRNDTSSNSLAVFLSFFGSLVGWVILCFVGLVLGAVNASSETYVGEVVSVRDSFSVTVLLDEDTLWSVHTRRGLQVVENQEKKVVAEIRFNAARRPSWWPRILTALPDGEVVGQPAITLKGQKDELEEIFASL